MDKFIDARFERVEKALATLIDSIAKYNPSTTCAHELAAADRELSRGLEELQTHQNNHLRIQQLRSQTASLDAQIRETLSTLAATRRDITSTTVTAYPDKVGYDIRYDELLSYARRISKFTLPAPGVTNGIDMGSGEAAAAAAAAVGGAGTPSSAGAVGTPASAQQTPAATPGPNASMSMSNGVQTPGPTQSFDNPEQQQQQQQLSQATAASTNIPSDLQAFLNPLAGTSFIPWPDEVKIRMGALSANQELAERGIDARGFDPAEEERRKQAAEQERREAEEKEQLAREESERRLREQRERARLEQERRREQEEREGFRRASMVVDGTQGPSGAATGPRGSTAGAGERRQFQFMGDMDDDDDDD